MDAIDGSHVRYLPFCGRMLVTDKTLYRMSRNNGKSAEYSAMEKLLSDLQGHALAWAFLQPVNGEEVADYYEVIKQPMGENNRLPAHLFNP